MFIRSLAALAAVLVMAAPGVASAQVWSDWSEADARTLVAAENGVVDEVIRPEDGTLEVYATFDGWLKVMIAGKDCTGRASGQRCKRMILNALFEIDDAAEARRLESELKYNFVADMADGEDYVVERVIEMTGGVNMTNLRAQVNGFIGVCELITEAAWPEKGAATPGKTR